MNKKYILIFFVLILIIVVTGYFFSQQIIQRDVKNSVVEKNNESTNIKIDKKLNQCNKASDCRLFSDNCITQERINSVYESGMLPEIIPNKPGTTCACENYFCVTKRNTKK